MPRGGAHLDSHPIYCGSKFGEKKLHLRGNQIGAVSVCSSERNKGVLNSYELLSGSIGLFGGGAELLAQTSARFDSNSLANNGV